MSEVPEAASPAVRQVEQWVGDECRSLGLPVTGAADDIFAAGGTSLTVIRLIAKAESAYGEGCLPPDDVYVDSTVAAIAASIVRNSGGTRHDGILRQGK